MNVKDLKEMLKHAEDDERVVIKVEPNVIKDFSIGGTPCVDIEHAGSGFDWDSGHFILSPKIKLTRAYDDRED